MKRPQLKRSKKPQPTDSRITNETVAEHRERILAGGRKFKYPHQYVRHRLVINAIIIAAVVVIGSAGLIWQQLYFAQSTADFLYRVTRVLPLPVGSVDGEQMRYSDYLMRYRINEFYLTNEGQVRLSGEDGQRQLDFYKREVMDGLAADTFAAKKARELNLSVSEQEIDAVVDANRQTKTGKISQEVYDASTNGTLGLSPSEYRHLIKQSLLRKKVAYAMDEQAKTIKDQLSQQIGADRDIDLQELSERLKADGIAVEFGASGLVPVDNQDGGLSKVVGSLENGETSDAVESTTVNGYYFVRRLSGNDRQISYEFIRVPLTVFTSQFNQLKSDDKVQEFITIPGNVPTESN